MKAEIKNRNTRHITMALTFTSILWALVYLNCVYKWMNPSKNMSSSYLIKKINRNKIFFMHCKIIKYFLNGPKIDAILIRQNIIISMGDTSMMIHQWVWLFTWKIILVGLLRYKSLFKEKVKTLYLYASMLYEGLYNFSTWTLIAWKMCWILTRKSLNYPQQQSG